MEKLVGVGVTIVRRKNDGLWCNYIRKTITYNGI